MLMPDRAAGSRMHVLDWLDGGTFIPSINEVLRPTGLFVRQSGRRMPKGWDSPDELRLFSWGDADRCRRTEQSGEQGRAPGAGPNEGGDNTHQNRGTYRGYPQGVRPVIGVLEGRERHTD
jgi:hypothetical protein